jgi:hypothetical protein
MFYDNGDHYTLALYANSKIVRKDSGNKNYLLRTMAIGYVGILSHVKSGFLYNHIYSTVYDLN